jgi:hypothetical protein
MNKQGKREQSEEFAKLLLNDEVRDKRFIIHKSYVIIQNLD